MNPKPNPALAILVATLIGSAGASLQAAESSAPTNAASTNASTTNSSLTILSPITVIAQDVTNGVVEGTDFHNPGGFGPIDSKAATRTFTPNMENPVSVQVVPQEVINSQQNIILRETIQNVAGVVPGNDLGGAGDSYSVRGFDMQDLTFEDGLRNNQYNGYQRSMQNVENVEVVKGPASVLYGEAEPGGLVNIDTKKPLTSNYFAVDQQLGSWAFYRTTVDASGPIDQEKKFLYRFNVDQQNNYSYRDFIHTQRLWLFPTFRWQPNEDNQATLELTYGNLHEKYDNGVPFLTNGILPAVGRGANFIMPQANEFPIQDYVVKFSATHKFNDDWMLHGAYRTEFVNNPQPNAQYYYAPADSNGNLGIERIYQPTTQQWQQEYLADLTGKFKTWFIKHTAILGFDYYQALATYNYAPPDNEPTYTQNIFSPNWNVYVPTGTNFSQNQSNLRNPALFVQDQMELPGHVFGMAGFRYDSYETDTESIAQGSSSTTSSYNSAVTPRFGLLWRPIEPVSIYGSYTANFGAPAVGVTTASGAPLPPQSAQQWEIGLKGETPNKKLSSTLSFYQLTKENIPVQDSSDPNFYQAIGQAQSKGIEFQLAGEILSGWKIIFGYSYINAFTTKDNAPAPSVTDNGNGTTTTTYYPSYQGLRLPGVPYNSGSLWTTYEIQSGPLKRLRFGGGVIFRSEEQNYCSWAPEGTTSTTKTDANGNTVVTQSYTPNRIPAFGVVNLMAAYPFEVAKVKWTAQVNLNNLFNTSYYSSVNATSAMPGAPVNFMASLKAEF